MGQAFFTRLADRTLRRRLMIVALRLLLEAGAAAVGLSGITSLHFWADAGHSSASSWIELWSVPRRWCWRRIGARSAPGAAFNDFLVFGMMAVGSFFRPPVACRIYAGSRVNIVVFPPSPPVLLGLRS